MKELSFICLKIVVFLYIFTNCLGPAILGFISGRYLPIVLRLFFVLIVLGAGYNFCEYSQHGFGSVFIPGNILYCIMCVWGLYLRKKERKKWTICDNADWFIIGVASAIFIAIYIPPEM
ncbi:MAG: hypothetical protein ABFD91_03355 [Anaerohalosphaeraceae bacterium]